MLTPGGCVEQVVVAASRVTPLPPGVDLEAAASFRGNYATAYYAMQRANLQAGETLLVHGAAGGVGLAAVDIGKLYRRHRDRDRRIAMRSSKWFANSAPTT